jgi:hypothetical protein
LPPGRPDGSFEILDQPLDTVEAVGMFDSSDVPVVPLSAFVIKEDKDFTRVSVKQRVFEHVRGLQNRRRHTPNSHLDDRAILEDLFVLKDQLGRRHAKSFALTGQYGLKRHMSQGATDLSARITAVPNRFQRPAAVN